MVESTTVPKTAFAFVKQVKMISSDVEILPSDFPDLPNLQIPNGQYLHTLAFLGFPPPFCCFFLHLTVSIFFYLTLLTLVPFPSISRSMHMAFSRSSLSIPYIIFHSNLSLYFIICTYVSSCHQSRCV